MQGNNSTGNPGKKTLAAPALDEHIPCFETTCGKEEQRQGQHPPFSVEYVNLAADIDRRVALVTLKIADICIHGVAIWRSRHGRLRVHFPSYNAGWSWEEAIELPPELRSEVEAEVIAAYKTAKAQAKKEEKGK